MTDMEYLEHISTKPPSKFSFINRKILIGAIAFVVLLVILIIVTVIVNNRGQSSSGSLSAQLSSFNTLVAYNSSNVVNSSEITKITAEASLVAASAQNQLTNVTTLPKPSKELLASEAVDTTVDELDMAKSTGNLSQKYTAALLDKLDDILASLEQLRGQVNSDSKRQIVEDVVINFTEIRNRLDAI